MGEWEVAGESAREVARKQREKAERLQKSAERWEKGAAGEQATARALTMLPTTWRVLHDVRWPGRRYANIDHIVVGPAGVFVIDSKAWSGEVLIRDGVLRQNGYNREREVAGAADSALAVAEAVAGLSPEHTHPVICLVRDDDLVGHAREVAVCTTANLVSTLLAKPEVIPAAAVGPLQGRVSWALAQAARPRRQDAAIRSSSGAPAAGPPVRGSRPPAPRRSAAGQLMGRLLVIGLAGIAALVGLGMVVALLSSIGDSVSSGASGRTPSPTSTPARAGGPLSLGQAGDVPRGTNRPPLRVTADRFVTTKSVGDASYLYPGNRVVAVRLTIRNLGKRTWVSQPGTQLLLKTESNIPYRVAFGSATLAGRALPEVIRLKSGKTLRANAVFQVPQSTPVTELDLTVGPGQPTGLSWTIDRQ